MRILLDCDGVIGQFHAPVIKIAERLANREFPEHLFTTWDMFDIFPPDIKEACCAEISQPGFCESLPPYEEALAGVEKLRRLGAEIFIVTAPWPSPTWMYERTRWLGKHFGITPRHVIHIEAKNVVQGNFLIEDKALNIREWTAHNPMGRALLVDRVYNRRDTDLDDIRVHNWDDIEQVVLASGIPKAPPPGTYKGPTISGEKLFEGV